MKSISEQPTGGDHTNSFEELLLASKGAVERFVYYKLPSKQDADDVLQETYLSAYLKFDTLRDKSLFKAWILAIARNKCNEYFREKAKVFCISLDELSEKSMTYGSQGITETDTARETLDKLNSKDQQILYLYFFLDLSYVDISQKLGIPLGTVKSRLHLAKEHFKREYPHSPKQKGAIIVKKLPEYLPPYKIEYTGKEPFPVRHEELPGMLIIPRKGEKLSFGMYDFPAKKLTGTYHMEVTNEVILHGVQGVEVKSHYTSPTEPDEDNIIFAQLTNTFCRYLGGMNVDRNSTRSIVTFVDDAFDSAYGIGENNCGFEVERKHRGDIVLCEGGLSAKTGKDVSDIAGRYTVTLDGKVFDTVRLVDIEESNNSRMVAEYYLDKHGRTILWRRFNRDDWAFHRYQKTWTEMLPENERLYINGETYVHWYDCVTDYVL